MNITTKTTRAEMAEWIAEQARLNPHHPNTTTRPTGLISARTG